MRRTTRCSTTRGRLRISRDGGAAEARASSRWSCPVDETLVLTAASHRADELAGGCATRGERESPQSPHTSDNGQAGLAKRLQSAQVPPPRHIAHRRAHHCRANVQGKETFGWHRLPGRGAPCATQTTDDPHMVLVWKRWRWKLSPAARRARKTHAQRVAALARTKSAA